MGLTREERKLLHQKSKQPTFGNGKPDNKDGNEGDISFRKVEGSGTVEYVKTNGEWVAVASSGEMPVVRIIGSTRGGGSSSSTSSGITTSYVGSITGGIGIDSTGATSGQNINHTLSLNLNELTDTAITTSDSIVFIDADDSNNSKKESLADVVTLLSGDGVQNSSNKFAVDVSDFVGTGLEDDGSENIRLATQGDGISGGNGSTLNITPTQTTITSIFNNSLKIGRATDDDWIDFGTDDAIKIGVDNTERLRIDTSGVDVTGTLNITTDTTFGTYSSPNYSDGILQSANFVSGFAGSGWKLNPTSNDFTLELDNMFLRGTLSVFELLIQQIRATNGAVFVTSAAKVESSSGLSSSDDDGTITFEDPSGNNICPFLENDIIMMQRINPGALVAGDAAGGATNVIKKLVYKVSSVSNNVATVTNIGYDNTTSPEPGDDFVRIGNTTNTDRQGLLYLTSDDSNAPFMDIKDGVDSYANWHGADTTKVRIGKLSGITDSAINSGNALSGFGLYGGNVFLKGEITAKSGLIGSNEEGKHGWKIENSKIYNNGEIQYIDFDGSGDGLSFGTQATDGPLAISSATGVSIAFWINFPTLGVMEQIWASHDNNSAYIGYWVQKNADNKIIFNWGNGGGTGSQHRESRLSDEVLVADTWYFVVITSTFHQSTVGQTNIYVNNSATTVSEPSGTGNISTPTYSATGLTRFAKEETGGVDTEGEYKMKNFAVWNTRLDATNTNPVTAIYNNGEYLPLGENYGNYTQSSNLKLHCDFTTGSANDLSGNHSSPSFEGGASIVNPYNNSFIGLVQASVSSITELDSDGASIPISSFFAGASSNSGANAAISFGRDGKIRGNGIYRKNNIDYLITASRIFGNGSDGAGSLSGSVVLTSDKYYTTLTLAASTQIHSAGYRIFVRDTLILSGSGIKIYNNGYTGNAGRDATSGSGGITDVHSGATATSNNENSFTNGTGAGAKGGSLLGGIVGGNGGAGGNGGIEHTNTDATAGSAGASVTGKSNCVKVYTTNTGARGASGGTSGSSTGGGSSTRAGDAATDGNVSITNADLTYIIAMKDFFTTATSIPSLVPASGAVGGGGGGGGGYGGNETRGGGGGSGGCAGGSGGHVMLVAREITGTLSHLELEAKGGTGGAGGDGLDPPDVTAATGGAGAGGNGGDGGCVVLITGTDPSDIVIDISGGSGGANGSGTTTNIGTPQTGESGTQIICHV